MASEDRKQRIERRIRAVEHVRRLGRPFPGRVPDNFLRDMSEDEAAEVRKGLGEEERPKRRRRRR